ncbi:hypothetical protein AB691_4249 [Stutzerimonas stutzeri]|nr:hypothetical protein AB691_4249 [Stutzerimonas stutzeri]
MIAVRARGGHPQIGSKTRKRGNMREKSGWLSPHAGVAITPPPAAACRTRSSKWRYSLYP